MLISMDFWKSVYGCAVDSSTRVGGNSRLENRGSSLISYISVALEKESAKLHQIHAKKNAYLCPLTKIKLGPLVYLIGEFQLFFLRTA